MIFEEMEEQIEIQLTNPESCSQEEDKHWIHNFYFMYFKFPCEDCFSQNETPLSLLLLRSTSASSIDSLLMSALTKIEEDLRGTKKPIRQFSSLNYHFKDIQIVDSITANDLFASLFVSNLKKIVETVITLTPLQIARCSWNCFTVLEKGMPLKTDDVKNSIEMKEKINFGLIESVIRNWRGRINVISSMGKQSTGKSYLLNHLFGSSFNISDTRCTDGCWMVVVCHTECLYVLLDFEGLGSLERTEQDDLLLSLFNSALSSVTLYKTETNFDRATERLFAKFNAGSNQLEGLSDSFMGKFMIIIKDVQEEDVQKVCDDFEEKIDKIVRKDPRNCFIEKLYRGGHEITPFANFRTEQFSECVDELRQNISETALPFNYGGEIFLETVKLLMAKLSIDDFVSLKTQHIKPRIRYLQDHLLGALEFGQLIFGDGSWHALSIHDQATKEIESKWTFKLKILDEVSDLTLDDVNLRLTDDGFSEAIQIFCSNARQTDQNFNAWRVCLENFLRASIHTRFSRVEQWSTDNLSFWEIQKLQEHQDEIAALRNVFEKEKCKIQQKFKLCEEKCESCFLKCTLIWNHYEKHSCSTNHICPAECSFCSGTANECKEPFGHEKKHICGKERHVCGKLCSFSSLNGCNNECTDTVEHVGEHICHLKVHTCSDICSHPECKLQCNIDCTQPHSVHKCSKNICLSRCCMQNCQKQCVMQDHFHGYKRLSLTFQLENFQRSFPSCPKSETRKYEDHFCDGEHICPEKCQENGYCEVSVEREEIEEELFEGKASSFSYSKKFASVGLRKACLVKIPPFRKNHRSKHFCSLSSSKVHTCTAKCALCTNICTKPYGHGYTNDKLHRTSHGNMVNSIWTSSSYTPFTFDNHTFVAGDSGKVFYCHVFCVIKGRGHTHLVSCPGNCDDQMFNIEKDKRRHTLQKLVPGIDAERDEVWHKEYFEKVLGFEDPCTAAESADFNKCRHKCSHENHDEDNPSYCVLDMWHTEDHCLPCKHPEPRVLPNTSQGSENEKTGRRSGEIRFRRKAIVWKLG